MGSDELIDVNPAPILEFLEDDHPSIVSRIRTIRNAIVEMNRE
jgi:STE24 endopeptidase